MEAKYHRDIENSGASNVAAKEEKQNNPLGFKELLEKYVLIYWKWYALSVAVALLIGLIYVRTQPETYAVQARLLIKNQGAGISETALLRQANASPERLLYSRLDTESELIRSQVLMERVIHKLGLHTTYTSARFLRQKDLYNYSPFEVKIDSVSLYRLQKDLGIVITPKNDGSFEVEVGDTKKEIKKFPYHVKVTQGVVSVYRREWVPITNRPLYVSITNPIRMAKILSGRVSANVEGRVEIMNLGITTGHPRKGGDILLTLLTYYNQDAINEINRSAINTINFIDERMITITQELSDVEGQAEEYKQEKGITDVQSSAQRYLSRDERFEMRSVDADMQLSMIKYVEEFIADPRNDFMLIPDLGLTDPSLSTVVRNYNDLIMTRDRLADGSSAENPTLKRVNTQLGQTRDAIKASIVNNRRILELSKQEISTQSEISQAKIYEIPRQQREFLSIQRQQQVKEQLYVFMLQRREEASLTMALAVDKAKILTPPDNAVLTGPNTKMTLLLALIIGLLVPFVIVFLLDWLDNTVQSHTDVEKICKLPVLTELGHNLSGEIILDHDSSKSADVELFRLLRTRLQFVLGNEGKGGKVALITSTEPGEGKSYISANLSISLSKTGKKVIFLGMDLRKPQLVKLFRLEKKEGISSYLSGMVTDYRDLIETKDEYPNLAFMHAGIIPPNPNELLMSDNLSKMINDFKKVYDYVIIDSAPLGAVSDTLLINRIADIVLYVCRINYSDISNLIFLNRLYDDKSLNNPYLILNDMKLESRYYYHRGYGYGYGYGYGHYYYSDGIRKSKKTPSSWFRKRYI
ncbi:MAG: polysaccharide biosynthesis tyrosine autokinase [Paludibacter sp.]|jgi:capsular exopolysaccharide synthesis family protein|nr:polysaccharide biosynthesis tyrosine autokinase [Paludibacter sp.]